MEPTDALRSIETALRLVIRDVLGETEWLLAPGAPEEARLRERRAEEDRRRDGATVSSNLLDYTETYHLTAIVERNWEKFQPVFRDKGRTPAFFGVIEDVRNSIAHSRDLVPFERDLISGIAGQIRNQVSLFRSSQTQSARYYPLIESVSDNFGRTGQRIGSSYLSFDSTAPRLEVGDVLTFTGTAFNGRGKIVKWQLLPGIGSIIDANTASAIEVAEGDAVTFDYTVQERDIGEHFPVHILITTDSKYHRSTLPHRWPYDDNWGFVYAVNPPLDD